MTIAYTTGQITLTNGSAVVTGIGTAWAVSLIAGGMIAAEAGGNLLPIESVDSDTSITAAIEWRGATGTYDYALVRDTAYLQQLSLNSATLARTYAELQAGTIFKYDASGDLAGRATYDERVKGFSYLVFIGVGEPALYVKASATAGDWDGPFAYGTGPVGPMGPAGYANPRGTYSAVTVYARNDAVLYNGSSFVALQATTGNSPPTLPATSNAFWQLTAIKGTDGAGTGDVVGPDNVVDGYAAAFNGVTGKIIKGLSPAQFRTWLAQTAASVSFSNSVAKLPGNPTTAQTAIEAVIAVTFQNFVKGLITSKSSAYVVSIAAGSAKGNGLFVTNPSAFTKNLNAVWAAGSGNGGRDTAAAITANTTYHLHALINNTTGDFDALWSLSPTAPTVPSGYSLVTRIDWAYTNATPNAILDYTQIFSVKHFPAQTWTNTTGGFADGLYVVPVSIPVPLGIPTKVLASLAALTSATGTIIGAIGNPAGFGVGGVFDGYVRCGATTAGAVAVDAWVQTDTSRQLRAFSSFNTTGSYASALGAVDDFTINRIY